MKKEGSVLWNCIMGGTLSLPPSCRLSWRVQRQVRVSFLFYGGQKQGAMGWTSWAQTRLYFIWKSELVEYFLVLTLSSPKYATLDSNLKVLGVFLAFFLEYSEYNGKTLNVLFNKILKTLSIFGNSFIPSSPPLR